MTVRDDTEQRIQHIFTTESRRVLATLIRLLGDFDLAEDALQEAFIAALRQWPGEGVPDNPRAWLVSAGRFKAIDQLRRRARHDQILHEQAEQLAARAVVEMEVENLAIDDDRLRLIFTCCHPGLARDARIVRAKAKIRDARIPYEVPEGDELYERLQSVLQVIYLVFNEGYLASAGDQVLRHDLSEEAIRLAELVLSLLPSPEPECQGLLALMLLHHARRATRTTAQGELVLLEHQDRSLWDRAEIARADELVRHALQSQRFGPYTLQAAIAAVHAHAPSSEATDWAEIVGLYDLLLTMMPSPIVALNRAVAVAMRDGPEIGLQALAPLMEDATLHDYHLAHAAQADMHRRLGQRELARSAYQAALERASQPAEQRFLRQRLVELG